MRSLIQSDTGSLFSQRKEKCVCTAWCPELRRQPQNEDDLKIKDDLKNEDDLKNKDDLKNEDTLKK